MKPGGLASFFGFTPSEVATLAEDSDCIVDELRNWYDGYQIGDQPSLYNPYSVIEAIAAGECDSYWSATGAYDSVVTYIKMNFDGLKDDIIKMLAGGKGFADLVFIPRRNVDSPALLIELKCNKSADAAIDQIKRKEYPAKVAEYMDSASSPTMDSASSPTAGNILLVGINYDRETKTHTCKIERYTKE